MLEALLSLSLSSSVLFKNHLTCAINRHIIIVTFGRTAVCSSVCYFFLPLSPRCLSLAVWRSVPPVINTFTAREAAVDGQRQATDEKIAANLKALIQLTICSRRQRERLHGESDALLSRHLHNVLILFQSGGEEVWTSGLTTVTVRAAVQVIIFDFHQIWPVIMRLKWLEATGGNLLFIF